MQVIENYEIVEDYVENDLDKVIWQYADLNNKYNLLMVKYIELEKRLPKN